MATSIPKYFVQIPDRKDAIPDPANNTIPVFPTVILNQPGNPPKLSNPLKFTDFELVKVEERGDHWFSERKYLNDKQYTLYKSSKLDALIKNALAQPVESPTGDHTFQSVFNYMRERQKEVLLSGEFLVNLLGGLDSKSHIDFSVAGWYCGISHVLDELNSPNATGKSGYVMFPARAKDPHTPTVTA
eukprot:1055310_1